MLLLADMEQEPSHKLTLQTIAPTDQTKQLLEQAIFNQEHIPAKFGDPETQKSSFHKREP